MPVTETEVRKVREEMLVVAGRPPRSLRTSVQNLGLIRVSSVASGLAWLLIMTLGCGKQASPRFELSGSVTFDGKPVPAGSIIFTPDHAKENRGPGAMTSIENGRYSLPEARGTIGGPHVVTISGFDGVATKSGPAINHVGKPVFANYQSKVDLPPEKGEQNFEVPKSAAR